MRVKSKLGDLPFDPETLTLCESVKTWLSAVNLEHTGSDRTRGLYLMESVRWVEWTGKNPDQLKKERIEQSKNIDEEVKLTVERLLNEYFAHLQKKGFSSNLKNAPSKRTLRIDIERRGVDVQRPRCRSSCRRRLRIVR